MLKSSYTMEQRAKHRKLTIGNDVWVGVDVTLVNGIAVGDGAVIGASSVVREDVPAYAIVTGNPARVVKYRFPESTIRDLLEIRWWDWEDEDIIKSDFFEKNVTDFIRDQKEKASQGLH